MSFSRSSQKRYNEYVPDTKECKREMENLKTNQLFLRSNFSLKLHHYPKRKKNTNSETNRTMTAAICPLSLSLGKLSYKQPLYPQLANLYSS